MSNAATDKLPNRLRELREAAGEKPETLALEMDLGTEQIRRWERGHTPIPTVKAIALAERYGVRVGYLLGQEDKDEAAA